MSTEQKGWLAVGVALGFCFGVIITLGVLDLLGVFR